MSFGVDLRPTPPEATWAFNYDQIIEYLRGDYLLQMTSTEPTAIYNYIEDPLLTNNLLDSFSPNDSLFIHARAFLQSLNTRMKTNQMKVKTEE